MVAVLCTATVVLLLVEMQILLAVLESMAEAGLLDMLEMVALAVHHTLLALAEQVVLVVVVALPVARQAVVASIFLGKEQAVLEVQRLGAVHQLAAVAAVAVKLACMAVVDHLAVVVVVPVPLHIWAVVVGDLRTKITFQLLLGRLIR